MIYLMCETLSAIELQRSTGHCSHSSLFLLVSKLMISMATPNASYYIINKNTTIMMLVNYVWQSAGYDMFVRVMHT